MKGQLTHHEHMSLLRYSDGPLVRKATSVASGTESRYSRTYHIAEQQNKTYRLI